MSVASVIGVFDVADLPSNHPEVFPDKGGKAVPATKTKGFLSFGPYVTGYRQPPKFLDVYFSIYIDDNKGDNAKIVTLDVYDGSRNKTLARQFFRKRQFEAGLFNLFKLSATGTNGDKSLIGCLGRRSFNKHYQSKYKCNA